MDDLARLIVAAKRMVNTRRPGTLSAQRPAWRRLKRLLRRAELVKIEEQAELLTDKLVVAINEFEDRCA